MRTSTTASLFFLPLLTSAAPMACDIHPVFTLNPINLSSYYTYTTPAHAGPKLGSISFTLQNDQTNYMTECSGSSPMPFGQFYDFQTFDCTVPSGAQMSFSYDTSTKIVSLNSTWSCGG